MKTTNNFKIGDKVYVLPQEPPFEDECYIRATVTSIHPELGYMLRAFREDLPGLYMGRIWDDRLIARKDKTKHKATAFVWKDKHYENTFDNSIAG